jgi:catechol 2,3-dioxygenase-like lactoylglutathione lyase family enzyme
MIMHLDYTVIPAKDSEQAAAFYAEILGLKNLGHYAPFYAVAVDDYLTLLFINKENIDSRHYAFIVTKAEFSQIISRVKHRSDIQYGDSSTQRQNNQLYQSENRTGFYFDDKDGHILEVIKDGHILEVIKTDQN